MNEPRTPTQANVDAFIEACQAMINDHYAKQYPKLTPTKLTVSYGKKYGKIIADGGSAWGFIDMTNGNILKASSWKAPAKHARGNILSDDMGMKAMSPYGPAYLR